MAVNRSWEAFPATYRAKEMQTLASWILSGESGSVVGLIGCGRSNLLGFLCHRPEVLRTYMPPRASPVALIPIDLNDLPAKNASTLYRVILRSFDSVRDCFEPSLQQATADLYQETHAAHDPFLPQSALHKLLLLFQEQGVQVVLVFNRFDRFCENASAALVNTLRGLRDNFKDTLCYIVGMHQEVVYLSDPTALGDMYDLLDSHLCWVGPMSNDDARHLIARATFATPTPPSEAETAAMLSLSGNFPILLRTICYWWLAETEKPPLDEWESALSAERSIQYRLARMWDGLTQEEQLVLSEVQKLGGRARNQKTSVGKKREDDFRGLAKKYPRTFARLVDKGLCVQTDSGWQVYGDLLDSYIADVGGRSRGKIWPDEHGQIYQGSQCVEGLTHLQKRALLFFIENPYKQHDHSTIIDNTWPEDELREGITNWALQTLIRELRKKIEPNPSKPCYIISWRGRPEGGYQFFPEGRPG
jgi:hypothetical protein